MFESHPGVYSITCKTSGYQYIGASKNVKKRVLDHLSALRNHRHANSGVQYSYDTYGVNNLEFKVLEYVKGKDNILLVQKEQYYINLLHPAFNVQRVAVNNGLKERTLESKQKISAAKRNISDETRMKMSEAAKRRAAERGMTHVTEAAVRVNSGKERSSEVRSKISQTKLTKFQTGEYTHHLQFKRDEHGRYME